MAKIPSTASTSSSPPIVTHTTPYAAMIIWNYKKRIGSDTASAIYEADHLYINSLSCVQLQTSKSKNDPQGSFSAVLAPTCNWVAAITPGSWACVLMSNKPITADDMKKLDPSKLKMFGKIDTVRLETSMNADGMRSTAYYVNGMDWGHVFNSTLYIDPDQVNATEPSGQKGGLADALQKLLFVKGAAQLFTTNFNLNTILQIFGKSLYVGQEKNEAIVGVKIQSVYSIHLPTAVAKYLNLKKGNTSIVATDVNSALTLKTGILTKPGKYRSVTEAIGTVNLFDFLGTHTFWELLHGNGCDVLNEMYAEMEPSEGKTGLILYNRIRPFTLKGSKVSGTVPSGLRSLFQNIPAHNISPSVVLSINAGTNWADRFNFIEIKPIWNAGALTDASNKAPLQSSDPVAWNREGFRALIFNTKYFPGNISKVKNDQGVPMIGASIKWEGFKDWVAALRSWYFDTHKMLNGTLQIIGGDSYIAVGNNIKVDANILNPVHNWSAIDSKTPSHFLLAHIESVQNTFSISTEGTKQYRTTITFVRGVIVDAGGNVLTPEHSGALAGNNNNIRDPLWRNDKGNIYGKSEYNDPDQ